MINTVGTYKPNTQNLQPSTRTKASIFYVNDLHGRISNMQRIKQISDVYDKGVPAGTDKLKLSAGDIYLGSGKEKNKVANQFLNWIGVSVNTLGNHELDASPKDFAEILNDAKYKILGLNLTVDKNSALYGKIIPATVQEINGHQYGLIGLAPPDALDRVGTRESVDEIKIDDLDTTIKKVQMQIEDFKQKGIDKIVVVSHIGYENDKRLAQETSGIDIIIGGHSHELIKGIKENENLLYSKTGEPVIITQGGKDGDYAGILNVEFVDGVIVKAQNNVIKTFPFNRSLVTKHVVESIVGKPEVLGTISHVDPSPKNRLIEDNPHGDFIVDAMRDALKTDVAILNSGNIRNSFKKGEVTTNEINDITPFEDKMMILELSEKQIVDAIKVGGKSLVSSNSKPGILLVSGLEYTMDKNGKLLKLDYIDKNGIKQPIDVNNPSETRKLTVATDDFFAYGGDNYMPVNNNPDYVLKKYDVDKNIYTAQYVKKQNKPIEIKSDGRIKIVDA